MSIHCMASDWVAYHASLDSTTYRIVKQSTAMQCNAMHVYLDLCAALLHHNAGTEEQCDQPIIRNWLRHRIQQTRTTFLRGRSERMKTKWCDSGGRDSYECSFVCAFIQMSQLVVLSLSSLLFKIATSLLFATFLSSLFTQSYLIYCLLFLSSSPPIPISHRTLLAKV